MVSPTPLIVEFAVAAFVFLVLVSRRPIGRLVTRLRRRPEPHRRRAAERARAA
jgi:hypothetical protein